MVGTENKLILYTEFNKKYDEVEDQLAEAQLGRGR